MQAAKAKFVENFGEQMRNAERSEALARQSKDTIKKTISALKFVLPKAASLGAMIIPGLGGLAIPAMSAWQLSRILDGIDQIKQDLDSLISSDYKSTMIMFKDILIQLADDVEPDLDDVKAVYRKAIDGYTKFDASKVLEKVEKEV